MDRKIVFTTADLLAELEQYRKPIPDRREGGVTRKEFASAQKCSIKLAGDMLEGLVEQGVLVREHCRLAPSSLGYVYYRNEG